MMRRTAAFPVRGREHPSTILCEPSLATCSTSTTTFSAPWTRSMASPMPLTIVPGIIQFAMSPRGRDVHGAEDRGVDLGRPRIMPNDVAQSKEEAPSRTATATPPEPSLGSGRRRLPVPGVPTVQESACSRC